MLLNKRVSLSGLSVFSLYTHADSWDRMNWVGREKCECKKIK